MLLASVHTNKLCLLCVGSGQSCLSGFRDFSSRTENSLLPSGLYFTFSFSVFEGVFRGLNLKRVLHMLDSSFWWNLRARVARFFLVQICQNGKNVPNDHKLYQKAVNYTKWPQNIPSGLKCKHIFYFKALQILPKLGSLVWKRTIWQPCLWRVDPLRLTGRVVRK
jgi:hypothetical protein